MTFGEGLCQHLKGLELRHVCCFRIPHPRHELRNAVNQLRRKPCLIKRFLRRKTLALYHRPSRS